MPTTICIKGKNETMFQPDRDFAELLRKHLGDEAATFYRARIARMNEDITFYKEEVKWYQEESRQIKERGDT